MREQALWADRYSRQTRFAPIGQAGQEKLRGACVLIVGSGALGASLAQHMTRAGVGTVRLADRDFVEPSNLQRQMLFEEDDALEALPKAVAAANKLRRINSEVNVEPYVVDVTSQNVHRLVQGADLVLDGTDNARTRLLLSDVCFAYGIPFLYGGVAGAQGMSAVLVPGETACLRCLIGGTEDGEAGDTCDTVGVISPVVEWIAALQSAEALKWLSGSRDALRRTWLTANLWPYRVHESALPGPSAACLCCGAARSRLATAGSSIAASGRAAAASAIAAEPAAAAQTVEPGAASREVRPYAREVEPGIASREVIAEAAHAAEVGAASPEAVNAVRLGAASPEAGPEATHAVEPGAASREVGPEAAHAAELGAASQRVEPAAVPQDSRPAGAGVQPAETAELWTASANAPSGEPAAEPGMLQPRSEAGSGDTRPVGASVQSGEPAAEPGMVQLIEKPDVSAFTSDEDRTSLQAHAAPDFGEADGVRPADEPLQTAALCGRDTVQVTLGFPIDLESMRRRLTAAGCMVTSNPYLVRGHMEDGLRLAIFPDGRVLVQGTQDTQLAVALCKHYVTAVRTERRETG